MQGLLRRSHGVRSLTGTLVRLGIVERVARELGPDGIVLVCLSGRGDKDVDTIIASKE